MFRRRICGDGERIATTVDTLATTSDSLTLHRFGI